MPNPAAEVVDSPVVKTDLKSSRGFNHPITARLLCPMRLISKFDEDP
jgi:hypothetical protein